MRILRIILIDIEDQIHWMDEMIGTQFFDVVSSHFSMMKNFTDAFENNNDFESMMISAGMNNFTLELLKAGYVNVNRVQITIFVFITFLPYLLKSTLSIFIAYVHELHNR